MSFELFDPHSGVYPFCSDSDYDGKLMMIPSPIPKQNLFNSRISRNYNYYKNLQRRRPRNDRFSRRHASKSSSLNAISTLSIVSSPILSAEDMTDDDCMRNKMNESNNNKKYYNKTRIPIKRHTRRRKKKRIRTFYSKKWGNKLYGLTNSTNLPPNAKLQSSSKHNNNNLWSNRNDDITNINRRRVLSAFIEEENLDLNDTKSSPSPPSPSATPIDIDAVVRTHLSADFVTNSHYDSASNVEGTDLEDDNDSDDDDDHDKNIGYHNYDDDDQNSELEIQNSSNFKIVVSGPNGYDYNDLKKPIREYIPSDTDNAMTDCSSTDEEDDDGMRGNKGGLFLGGNNEHIGVYSHFLYNSDQSETEYLSAHSDGLDGFNELTIPNYYINRNSKNIMYRTHGNNDIGVSDIGSSDTDYYSQDDSNTVPSSTNSSFIKHNYHIH